jgi:predicted RNase H-like HicB family nuclease
MLATVYLNTLIISAVYLACWRLKMQDFDVVLLEDETGGYVAIVPALPGCHTQGDTLAEVMENVKEAIDLYWETLTAQEKKELLKERVVGIQKVKALA